MTLDQLLDKWAAVLADGGWGGDPAAPELTAAREALTDRALLRALRDLLLSRGVANNAQVQSAVGGAVIALDAELSARYPRNLT